MDAIDERDLTTSGAGPRLARRGNRCRDQGHYPGVSLDEAFFRTLMAANPVTRPEPRRHRAGSEPDDPTAEAPALN
jgi:hypothetical protein